MLFELVKGYGDIAVINANICYVLVFCFFLTLIGWIFYIFLDRIRKAKESIKIIVSVVYAIIILWVLYYSIKPTIVITEHKDSRTQLSLSSYELYHTNGEYILVDKDTGKLYSTIKDDYIKYKVCSKPKLYMYDYTIKYTNILYGIGAVNTATEIVCGK